MSTCFVNYIMKYKKTLMIDLNNEESLHVITRTNFKKHRFWHMQTHTHI